MVLDSINLNLNLNLSLSLSPLQQTSQHADRHKPTPLSARARRPHHRVQRPPHQPRAAPPPRHRPPPRRVPLAHQAQSAHRRRRPGARPHPRHARRHVRDLARQLRHLPARAQTPQAQRQPCAAHPRPGHLASQPQGAVARQVRSRRFGRHSDAEQPGGGSSFRQLFHSCYSLVWHVFLATEPLFCEVPNFSFGLVP